ncbi:MAG: hypothetical protein GC193_00775 [Cryomorphaceae bacterium]|nr:hypothetical protein [Cryomorphaceae bacterium]
MSLGVRTCLFWLFALVANLSSGQCFSGTLTVSGPGCGCLAGCNLTAFGGVNCGSGATGNCTAGQINMSILIPLDPTCEVTVEARMSNRPGCSSSGADSGDRLRVRNSLGPLPPWQTGSANASLFDAHTQTGGTIVVEGNSNRADEIITYDVIYVSGGCPFCLLLPIELTRFDALLEEKLLSLAWTTASELNNRGFYIQISTDAEDWSLLGFVEGNGTTSTTSAYKFNTLLPYGNREWYVRLVQEDINGTIRYLPTLHIEDASAEAFRLFSSGHQLIVENTSSETKLFYLEVFDMSGRGIVHEQHQLEAGGKFEMAMKSGLFVARVVPVSGTVVVEKLLIGE